MGPAGLGLLAKYHRLSGDRAVRLPGISRRAFVSVLRTQSQAHCSHLAKSVARLYYDPRYYAANVFDPDGYSLEAVYMSWQQRQL